MTNYAIHLNRQELKLFVKHRKGRVTIVRAGVKLGNPYRIINHQLK